MLWAGPEDVYLSTSLASYLDSKFFLSALIFEVLGVFFFFFGYGFVLKYLFCSWNLIRCASFIAVWEVLELAVTLTCIIFVEEICVEMKLKKKGSALHFFLG